MDNIRQLQDKHYRELEEFIKDCPHTDVSVEDNVAGFRWRTITIRCKRCDLNLLGYEIDGSMSFMSYVRACVNGYPGSRDKKG